MFHILRQWAQRVVGILLLIFAVVVCTTVALMGVGPPLPFGLVMVALGALLTQTTLKMLNYKHHIIGDGQKWRPLTWGAFHIRPRLWHTAWPLLN